MLPLEMSHNLVVLQSVLTLDALPENNQRVIFYVPRDDVVEAGYHDADQEMFIIGIEGAVGYEQGDISVWLLLPEPLAFNLT